MYKRQILVDGAQVDRYSSKQLTTYRRYDIGFVFQFYNLVQNLTALENVELAAQICRCLLYTSGPLSPLKRPENTASCRAAATAASALIKI